MRAMILMVAMVVVACDEPCDEVVFPGWDRIPAVSAAAYCEERGAELVEVPTTEAPNRRTSRRPSRGSTATSSSRSGSAEARRS